MQESFIQRLKFVGFLIQEIVRKWLIKAMEDFKISQHELNLPDEEIITRCLLSLPAIG
jgi:hypothetical protein